MFDNIGGKIKSLAQVVCWIGIICSVIYGIIITSSDEEMAVLGFIIIVIGSLISWVSSFTLYGFGQLIENTDQLVHSTKVAHSNKENISTQNNKKSTIRKQETLSKHFIEEIKNTATDDLQLILEDQQDLYTFDEIAFIENELSNRHD